jgi:hypothetical protein
MIRPRRVIWAIALFFLTQTISGSVLVEEHFWQRKEKLPGIPNKYLFEGVPDVRLQTTLDIYTTYFTPNGLILAGFAPERRNPDAPPKYFELKILLQNAMPTVEVSTLNPRLSRADFFGSADPSWLTIIPSYAKVKYANLYPDVDMLFQINQRQLDFRFVIAPGGDPAKIRLQVQGAEQLRVTPEGTLLLNIDGVTFEIPKPAGYQTLDNSPARSVVAAQYVVTGSNEIALRLARYDPRRTLIIAP